MLRDHEIFNSPLVVDRSRRTTVPTPDAWSGKLAETKIEVIPLVEDTSASYRDGWCVYTYEHTQAPELEIICSGINTKTPKASALWRQGYLFHFGFEPSPAEMNDNGRALLINSICYIAGFRNDRPIVRTPSPFYSKLRFLDRGAIDRLVKNESRDFNVYLTHYLAPAAKKQIDGMTRKQVAKWYHDTRPFLRADGRGKFIVDTEAQEFGVGFDESEFIEAAIAAITQNTDKAKLARTLLARYAPDGPGEDAEAVTWKEWWSANRPYLFFTDTGGFCWQIDPLAKARGIPSARLRGRERMR